jgi:integrase
LPAEVFARLPLLGANKAEKCWTFPEVDAAGTVIGVTRRFLDGSKKRTAGGRSGLTLADGWRERPGPVLLVEGPTDLLALTAAGLCAVGRPSNTGGVDLFAELLKDWPADREILVVGENDRKPDGSWPGRSGAERTAAALAGRLGRPVPFAMPPDGAKDVRQWLTDRAGEAADWPTLGRELLAALTAAAETPAAPRRPVIRISTQEHDVNDRAAAALGLESDLFRRGGALVRVVTDSAPAARSIRRPTGPRIDPISPASLRERLARCVEWRQVVGRGDNASEEPAHPPGWCVQAVHARRDWPAVPPLEAVVDYPVLTPDGSILLRPGYDRETGLLYQPPGELPLTVPAAPTRADVRAAAGRLLDVVADFPFASDAYKAAWLAALLTPLARFAFPGPAPLFLVDANVRAAGKGLLCDTVSHIVTGQRFTVCDYTNDREELRMRITSLAVQGDRLVLFDNLDGPFGNGTLDAALTGSSWQDRLLGTNTTVRAPLFVTWYATGNNVTVGADTARRVCHIRLESPLERPEERGDFRHPELLGWIDANRPSLLSDALTVLRGWYAAGRPDAAPKPWGSFTGWSGVVRNAVLYAGLPDPGETRGELQERSDTVAESMTGLLIGLEQLDPRRRGLTAADIIDRGYKNPPAGRPAWWYGLRAALDALLPRADARVLGYKLRSFRLLIESPVYIAKYRDGHGVVREVSTKCRDEQAARRVLADLERKAELIRSGVITADEADVARHNAVPLAKHVEAYGEHLRLKQVAAMYHYNTLRHLNIVAADCGFSTLSDLRRGPFERWLLGKAKADMAPRTRNGYREALVGFCNWCVQTRRLTHNPFAAVPKANEKIDLRRKRRALTEAELTKLLRVAQSRPVEDAKRKTAVAVSSRMKNGGVNRPGEIKLSPEHEAYLVRLGRERALIYKTLVLTGLRKGELASLTVSQLRLDGDQPHAVLNAADEKNRQGSLIPLRTDLVAELSRWLADRLSRLQDEARRRGGEIPETLPPDARLFRVPRGLYRALDLDLKAAGIPKRDADGRQVDVHALRHTFGTLLSKGGVTPRTAQAAMRHSDLRLTMNVYTDSRLLDTAAAVNRLPPLPPVLAPNQCKPGHSPSHPVIDGQPTDPAKCPGGIDVTSCRVNETAPVALAGTTGASVLSDCVEVPRLGLEPRTR